VIEDAPVRIAEGEWEAGLWWMVLASGTLHVLLIAAALFAPISFGMHRPAPVSYTVDLIAPERLGGTNMVAGGKGRTTAPPLVAAEPAPPAPKVEEPKSVAAVEPEKAPQPPKPEAVKAPEPPKAEPAPPQAASKPEPEPLAPPKVEEAKPHPKPKEPEPKPKAVEPKPNPHDMVIKDKAKAPEPQPAKPAASPQAAKAEPVKAPSPKAAQKAESGSQKAGAAPKAGAQKKAEAKVAKAAGAGSDLDTRIAAAIKRVEQQSGVRGGGLGSKSGESPGGPVGVGPGEGVGGAVAGFEYLLYLNQLTARLKQNWAWAGADRNRKAVVRFSILETGEVVDVRITEASGDPTYDASVERAVRAANPMPPPPEAYRKQFSDVEYTFTPESMEM
jgi:TolA protein